MSDRVQETMDRLDVTNVLGLYCEALDTRRWELLTEVFAPAARFEHGSGVASEGVEQIAAFIRDKIGDLDATQHLIGSLQVKVDGDTASARSHLIGQHVRAGAPGGAEYLIGGTYVDELRRTEVGWRIVARRLDRLWTSGNRDVIRR